MIKLPTLNKDAWLTDKHFIKKHDPDEALASEETVKAFAAMGLEHIPIIRRAGKATVWPRVDLPSLADLDEAGYVKTRENPENADVFLGDYLTRNGDRHAGNYLVHPENGKMISIDHDYGFVQWSGGIFDHLMRALKHSHSTRPVNQEMIDRFEQWLPTSSLSDAQISDAMFRVHKARIARHMGDILNDTSV